VGHRFNDEVRWVDWTWAVVLPWCMQSVGVARIVSRAPQRVLFHRRTAARASWLQLRRRHRQGRPTCLCLPVSIILSVVSLSLSVSASASFRRSLPLAIIASCRRRRRKSC